MCKQKTKTFFSKSNLIKQITFHYIYVSPLSVSENFYLSFIAKVVVLGVCFLCCFFLVLHSACNMSLFSGSSGFCFIWEKFIKSNQSKAQRHTSTLNNLQTSHNTKTDTTTENNKCKICFFPFWFVCCCFWLLCCHFFGGSMPDFQIDASGHKPTRRNTESENSC